MNTLEFLEEILPKYPEVKGIHIGANIFPLPTQDEFAVMVEDINRNGLLTPIVLTHNGVLVDGRSRLMACYEAGVEPRFERLGKQTDIMATAYTLNMVRRHLTAAQKACVAVDILSIFEDDAKARMKAGKKAKNLGAQGEEGNPPELFPEGNSDSETGESREKAARVKQLGKVGKRTLPQSFQFVPTDQGIQAVNPRNPTGAPINTGMQPPPSAATVQGRREAQSGISALDAAEKAVEANPGAFGLPQGAAGATELGASILNNFSTPDEITARAVIADIGSKKIHDRSGAAVTISEQPRLKPFIPSASDSPKAIKAKLKQLRARMAEDGYSFGLPAGSLDKPAKRYRLKPGANPDLKSSYEVY